jgi:hypothetical protein
LQGIDLAPKKENPEPDKRVTFAKHQSHAADAGPFQAVQLASAVDPDNYWGK